MWNWVKQNKYRVLIVTLLLLLISASIFRSKNPIVAVKKVEFSKRTVEKSLSISGVVKSKNEANLSFVTGGKILKLYVAEGAEIKKGQLLAQLDNSSSFYDLQALKDARDVAERDLDLYVELNVDANSGDDDYELSVRRLKELLSKAQAAYDSGRSTFGKTYVYAPFDGDVVDLPFSEGETVAATNTVVKLVDISNLIFEAQVDQEDFGSISKDMKINIKLDAHKSAQFEGVIEALPNFVDENTGNFVISIKLVNYEDLAAKPVTGMVGDAFVVLNSVNDAFSLSFDEINYDDQDKPFVWTLENNKIVKKEYIDTGLEGDIYTEIKTDLSAEIIVAPVNSDDTIDYGYSVRIVNE